MSAIHWAGTENTVKSNQVASNKKSSGFFPPWLRTNHCDKFLVIFKAILSLYYLRQKKRSNSTYTARIYRLQRHSNTNIESTLFQSADFCFDYRIILLHVIMFQTLLHLANKSTCILEYLHIFSWYIQMEVYL